MELPKDPRHDPRCDEIADPDIINFVLSIFILVGILVSYLPQHYRIIKRRSSEGLSAWFILLGTTSGTCAIANVLMHPTSRSDISCCSVNSAFSCAAGLLGILQIGVQWSCFFLITLLFLIFIPRPGVELRGLHSPIVLNDSLWRDAVLVVSISIIHFIATFIICVIFMARFPEQLLIWANILGTTSAVLASIQYLPQIWTTWRRQHIGSLSIPMMCIQTPGSFVFVASLAIRLGADGWSVWIVYLVTGTLQAVLLVMAIVFERRDRRRARAVLADLQDTSSDELDAGGDGQSDDENVSLIERDRLAERERQNALSQRRAKSSLNPNGLRRGPVASSSDNPPDDLLIDTAAIARQENEQRSRLSEVASSITAPFRRQSARHARFIDSYPRENGQTSVNGAVPATGPAGGSVGRTNTAPERMAADSTDKAQGSVDN